MVYLIHSRLVVMMLLLSALIVNPAFAQNNPVPTPPGSKSLADQVGFADPALTDLETRGLNTLGDSLEFKSPTASYRLLAVWEMLTDSQIPLGGTALLYRTDGTPRLIWSFDYARYNGQAPYFTKFNTAVPGSKEPLYPPGAWFEGDARINFAVASVHSGTSWSSYIVHAYTLNQQDQVQSLFKGAVPPGYVVGQIQAYTPQSPLFTVYDLRGEMVMDLPNCCGPHFRRYFALKDGKLTDVSADVAANYDEMIGYAVRYLTTGRDIQPNDAAARLLEMLMAYDASNQREAGWQFVQFLAVQARQSGRIVEGDYLEKTFLPAMQKQYEANQPFIAPDVAASQTPFTDWYDEQSKLPS